MRGQVYVPSKALGQSSPLPFSLLLVAPSRGPLRLILSLPLFAEERNFGLEQSPTQQGLRPGLPGPSPALSETSH